MLVRATLAAAYLGGAAVAEAAPTPAAKCAAAKMKAVGKRGRDRLVCHVRAIGRGTAVDPACIAKADDSFTAVLTRLDTSGGCAHPGDAGTLAADGDAFLDDVLPAAPGGENAHCRGAILGALARHLTHLVAAEAAFARIPDMPFRLVAARPAADTALASALDHARCNAPPNVTQNAAFVRAYAADVAATLVCGDAVRDPGEQCDGSDDAGCPGACTAGCRCPAASAAFACLDRPGPVITLTGVQPPHYEDLALAATTKLDVRNAVFAADPDNRYPLNLGGGAGVCVAGGAVRGGYDRALDWATMHDQNNAGMRSEGARFTFDGPRIDDVTDGLRPVGGPFTVRQAWLSYVRDDCIENDHLQGGLVIDGLLDGCYVALSERPSPQIVLGHADGRHKVLAIHRSLVRLEPMPGPRGGTADQLGHGQFFKWDARSSALALHDNVFLAEQVGEGGAQTMGVPDALVSCANNVMVWLGSGSYPAPLPACFTITTDRAVWDDAVATWKTRHPAIGNGE
jgi:hypothetical protein